MNNVKLDWGPILEGQIKHLESLYPDIPIRKSFHPLIESLNANRIKSRVILSGINVSAYAFITPSNEHTDRLYATVGFTDPQFVSAERTGNLMKWLEDTARIQNRYLMLNEIHNAEEKTDEYLFPRKYSKFVRKRLILDLNEIPQIDTPIEGKFESIPIGKVNFEKYSDSEFSAFSETADQILFNSTNRRERIEFSKGLFAGKLGKVIEPASKILSANGNIVAASLATDYRSLDGTKTALIANIFVDKKFQGKGIAKHLLVDTLKSLKNQGYEECALWVSTGNPARNLYDKFGFKDTGTVETFYYLKP